MAAVITISGPGSKARRSRFIFRLKKRKRLYASLNTGGPGLCLKILTEETDVRWEVKSTFNEEQKIGRISIHEK